MQVAEEVFIVASVKNQPVLDTIVQLAEEIGTLSPECASRAMQIVDLVRGLEAEPDLGTVQDALDAKMAESDLSDVSTRSAAAAVVKALR
jgi:hypothetical protein